jgi:MFS family permease
MMEQDSLVPELEKANFPLLIAEGTIFVVGMTFISYSTVLPAFVSALTGSSILVGLVSAARSAGWFIPQILIANYLESKPLKKPVMLLSSLASRLSLLIMAAATFFWGTTHPSIVLALFFILYFLYNLCESISAVAWVDITAKTIRPTRRGGLFSIMQLMGSLMGLGAGVVIRYILDHPGLEFPVNYSLVFFTALIVFAINYLLIIRLREPPGKVVHQDRGLKEYLRNMPVLFRKNPAFRKVAMVRILVSFTFMVVPFYVVYSRQVITSGAGIVGLYVLLQTAGVIIASLMFGRMSDRLGNRSVLRVTAGVTAALPFIALAVYFLAKQGQVPLLTVLYALIFIGIGISDTGQFIGFTNYVLDIASEAERPSYYALLNALSIVSAVLPLLGGILISRFNYELVFWISGCFLIIAFILSIRLPEPRRAEAQEAGNRPVADETV